VFGANKIPKLARSTGQAMGEFKKGREQVEDELQQMQSDDENESPLETDSTVNDDDDEFETETEKETSA